MATQEPPAVEPNHIQQQQDVLQEIKSEIDHAKPEVEACKSTGLDLMIICGEQDKPEVKKQIEDLDVAWDNVTALFAKREENLIDAMEKAMEFHDTLRVCLHFFFLSFLTNLNSFQKYLKYQGHRIKTFALSTYPWSILT